MIEKVHSVCVCVFYLFRRSRVLNNLAESHAIIKPINS